MTADSPELPIVSGISSGHIVPERILCQRTAIESLPSLRDQVDLHGLLTRKSLGQHFLFDLNLIDRIVRNAGTFAGHVVVEIGPGPGGLSRRILAHGCEKLIVIEHDSRCIPLLKELQQIVGDRLVIIEADALALDETALLREHNPSNLPVRLLSNLPYNIGTELLFKWLANPLHYQSYTLMFQKEVAERIAAKPGTKDYGRLSIIAQWLCKVTPLFEVHPAAFFPPPKVTSAIVHLVPTFSPDKALYSKVDSVLRAAFNQRRKMLRQSLKSVMENPVETLQQAGIAETARAEELSVAQFLHLAEIFKRRSAAH